MQSLGAPDWLALEGGTSQGPGVSHVEHDLLTCVWQLRKAVKQKPVAALVTFPAGEEHPVSFLCCNRWRTCSMSFSCRCRLWVPLLLQYSSDCTSAA